MFTYNSKTYDIPVVPLGGMLIITAYSMNSVHWRCDSSNPINWSYDYNNYYNSNNATEITGISYSDNVMHVTFSSTVWGGILVLKFS